MYFARTLLVPVLLIGGLVEVASAQHKYVFPQFVFGGGWASTLMVQASATPTTCSFSAQGRFLTMGHLSGNNISGTSITLTFGNERVDDPEDSAPAGHGGLVWHGGSRLQ